MAKLLVSLVVLSTFCYLCYGRPMGGKFKEVTVASSPAMVNGTCHTLGLYKGSDIKVGGVVTKDPKDTAKVTFMIKLNVFLLRCANFLDLESSIFHKPCSENPNLVIDVEHDSHAVLVATAAITKELSDKEEEFHFHENMTKYVMSGPTSPTVEPSAETVSEKTSPAPNLNNTVNGTNVTLINETNIGNTTRHKRAVDASQNQKDNTKPTPLPGRQGNIAVSIGKPNTTAKTGVYLLQVYIERQSNPEETTTIQAKFNIEMRNPHGYLSAVDYPGLVFYGVMTSVYAIFGITWIVLMLCSFNDLVRLQFWVLAVIILGFLEKTFFVAEYSAINLGNDTYGSYIVAEFVSAVKRGLSRMLLIIVAMGFGTVRPRLGDSLFKVVAAGVAYFSLALVDGIMRARNNTFHTNDTSSVVTLALLLLLDTFIFYWIFTAIVDTRRTLRLRKNYVKLAMYNHFAYTLIFAIVATIAFIIWVFIDLEYPSGLCLTDWKEVWLRDCFWHVLFAFILLVVMVIWRPSSNRSRFAYSLVNDPDDDDLIFEQGNNKNFDTVKMRSVNKTGSTSEPPPPVTSQAEDDLRWVEENLPTTAMDKALPLLLDSDEEVMTTKFEVSKMN